MRICIIEAGHPPDTLRQFGSYGDMIANWLRPALPNAVFEMVDAEGGAAMPLPEAFDAYVVSGSKHGVYENHPWMADLQIFLRSLRDHKIPVGGICFGHQIMAAAFGGTVEKWKDGWIVGPEQYGAQSALAFHQDQVVQAPESVIAKDGSPGCQFGRFDYDFPAISVQYHPEFTPVFVEALLDQYGGTRVPTEIVVKAMSNLNAPINTQDIAKDFAKVFATQA